MDTRRIESRTSRTAEMTCLSRAASYLDSEPHYHSQDHLAVRLLPGIFNAFFHIPPFRRFFVRRLAPNGIYEYVIARTKYIDAAFAQALNRGFEQILIFGAGFDTRALRLGPGGGTTRVFELDAAPTQQAKIQQYHRRGLNIPSNLVFIAIDFDKEALPDKLDAAGFLNGCKSLFILEGVLMYLAPESVRATLRTIQTYAGDGSLLVFDYVRASVLRGERTLYGEAEITQTVSKVGESWRFGLDPDETASFVADYGFQVCDQKDAQALETAYFQDADGHRVGRVNATHCILTAEKRNLAKNF
jgi:methyltransferase (TIGR00027 family)